MKNKEIEEVLEHLSATQKINNGWTSFSVKECKVLFNYIEQLENNRDKAIEYIEEDINECKYENRIDRFYLINILKGDSDE